MYIPPGFGTVNAMFAVKDVDAFVGFLTAGLGGRETLRSRRPDGRVGVVQVALGTSTVMVNEAMTEYPATAAYYYFYVENADAAIERAVAHGAALEMAVDDKPWGDRQGGVKDSQGNIWWISQRLVQAPYEV